MGHDPKKKNNVMEPMDHFLSDPFDGRSTQVDKKRKMGQGVKLSEPCDAVCRSNSARCSTGSPQIPPGEKNRSVQKKCAETEVERNVYMGE